MSLSDMTDLAVYPPFIRRVTAAMLKAAVAVGAEGFDGTTYKLARRALVRQTLEDPVLWGSRFSYAVVSNVAITFESTDNDIEFTVNSLWDAMSGAYQDAG
jgi:hypothetical protein